MSTCLRSNGSTTAGYVGRLCPCTANVLFLTDTLERQLSYNSSGALDLRLDRNVGGLTYRESASWWSGVSALRNPYPDLQPPESLKAEPNVFPPNL